MAFPSANANQKYAVLVGIDLYDEIDTNQNLSGCVNDINAVSEFLQNVLQIPRSQITALTAPNQTGLKVNPAAPGAPTRQNVLSALTSLEAKPRGAFIYFQYSGHGDRYPTRYRPLKGKGAQDEALCTWGDPLTDVDLGNILDRLAQKHAVCVVLDCCYSGGADRKDDIMADEGEKIRCRSLYVAQTDNKPHSLEEDEEENEDGEDMCPVLESSPTVRRDAAPRESYLYRTRKYNLIAAAQVNQLANERRFYDSNGNLVTRGVLTYYLMKSVPRLVRSLYPVTYGQLQSVISAQVTERVARSLRKEQHPVHIGNPNHLLFATGSAGAGPPTLLANVNSAINGSLTINRGWASHVAVGDEFLVYPPEHVAWGLITASAPSTIKVKVTQVRELESSATWSSPDRVKIESGDFAMLSKRSHQTIIDIHFSQSGPGLDVERIRRECDFYANPLLPINLSFNSSRRNADYVVTMTKDMKFDVQGHIGNRGNGTCDPPFASAGGVDNPKQLMGLLHHLGFYHLATRLNIQGSSAGWPRYEFEIQPQPMDSLSPPGSIACKNLRFKNLDSRPVYVTILNLTSAYGVQAILPGCEESSQAVDPGEEISIIVDLGVPKLLEKEVSKNQGKSIRDVIKLFVARQSTDFRHYLIPNLDVDLTEVGIKANQVQTRTLQFTQCVVLDEELLTAINGL